jgi:hypothetical protein
MAKNGSLVSKQLGIFRVFNTTMASTGNNTCTWAIPVILTNAYRSV